MEDDETQPDGFIKRVTLSVSSSSSSSFLSANEKKNKKRVVSEQWTFDKDHHYTHENQLSMIRILQANSYKSTDDDPVTKIALQQIQKKISGYKQQDLVKKKYREDLFLHLPAVIDKMVECALKCYYCCVEMDVLYDISREGTQWSVDRIDNDYGHNIGNFYLACLECNLKRRRRSDSKFLFTKQLKLVKKED
jgi:hypothetical protein